MTELKDIPTYTTMFLHRSDAVKLVNRIVDAGLNTENSFLQIQIDDIKGFVVHDEDFEGIEDGE